MTQPLITPICLMCKRLRAPEGNKPWSCEAFPDKIPLEIFPSGFDHREPFAGDGGIRFELDTEAANKQDVERWAKLRIA